MSTRIKNNDNWSDGRVDLVIRFGDLGYHVPYFARDILVSPVPTLLEHKFQAATQKIFTIPRINGEWAGIINKPRLNIAPIWRWIKQIQVK